MITPGGQTCKVCGNPRNPGARYITECKMWQAKWRRCADRQPDSGNGATSIQFYDHPGEDLFCEVVDIEMRFSTPGRDTRLSRISSGRVPYRLGPALASTSQ